MAFYRGIDGSLTVATVNLGQLRSWSMTVNVKNLDTSSVGDIWESSVTEIASWSGELECYVDDDLTAQATLWDATTGATPGGAGIAVQFIVSSGKMFSGNVLVKTAVTGAKVGAVDMVKFGFVGTGQLSLAWS